MRTSAKRHACFLSGLNLDFVADYPLDLGVKFICYYRNSLWHSMTGNPWFKDGDCGNVMRGNGPLKRALPRRWRPLPLRRWYQKLASVGGTA
jgi:hypothetical protein